RKGMSEPQGLLLVTGPAGSGKSTTLAALAEEFRRQALRVSSVDVLQGLAALEEILLGDPDVIVLDGVESPSVAARAVRAAVEGRRVVLAMDGADGVVALAKLAELKVDAHLLGLAVRAGLNQRLLGRICSGCREEYRESAATLEDLRLDSLLKGMPLWRGRGCDACGGNGTQGSIAVFEYGDRAADGSPREGF